MRSRGGVVGAVAGATAASVAASVAAGVAVERYAVNRLRGRLNPETLRGLRASHGRWLTVTAGDGTSLHVEIDGEERHREGAEPTIVFCHGYVLEHGCWAYQRSELGDLGRLVFWDQRCHGRSGRVPRESCTIESLGRDLYAVVNAVAPSGPLVLVGHSMGGMTIMAAAEQYPELFRDRVAGVALINTSAGGLAELIPGPAGSALRTVAGPLLNTLGRAARPVERLRSMNRLASHVSTQRFAFGNSDVSPELVAFMDDMISATPVDVVADFYPAIMAHDKAAALDAFRDIPTLVLGGTSDLVIPFGASRFIAGRLPDAEFVEATDAGHMVMLERPEMVNDALRGLVRRARGAPAAECTA